MTVINESNEESIKDVSFGCDAELIEEEQEASKVVME